MQTRESRLWQAYNFQSVRENEIRAAIRHDDRCSGVAVKRARRKAEKIRGRAHVFPSPTDPGRAIGSVRKAHNAAVENAGIKEHFRLYDLRHTFATRAAASGVDLPTLASMLGHTKIQMTMRYVHPAEEQRRAASAKLEMFRVEGLLRALEKSRTVPTKVPTIARVN